MANRKVPSTYQRCKGVLCEGCGEKPAAARGLCFSCYHKSKERLTWPSDPPAIVSHRRKLALRYCPVCGEQFRPRGSDRATVCSRKCGWVWQSHKRKLTRTGGRVSVSAVHLRCLECDKPFTREGKERCCSEACRAERQGRQTREWVEAERARLSEERGATKRQCAECGEDFVTAYGDQRRRFCSKKCNDRRVKRQRRKMERARLRDVLVESVDPTVVFERDGWRCQICGRKTLKSQRGLFHQRSPELDHIVPLAKGGEHSYRNTQLACRACNMAKSDGAGGQLLLFGEHVA